jgi:alpha- and gamma-adaptin-binding protein p34
MSIWIVNLGEEFSLGSLPHQDQLAALVMVFDMSDVRTELSFLTFYATYSSIVIFDIQF